MKYGKLLVTRTVNDYIAEDIGFSKEITNIFKRYLNHDWGEMCEEDKQLNDKAIELEKELSIGERVLAAYNTTKGKVYIITEWDRSATTILFADEY